MSGARASSSVQSSGEKDEADLDLIDDSGTVPVVRGTSTEAYRIAALTIGMSVGEIVSDYPSLTERDIAAAKVYAEAHPFVGPPYPTMTAKKAMRSSRDVSAFLPTRK